MRNLKRALSLTLASVMLLGMMVVGSSAAAGYDDVSETDNVEAIEVLQAVEVMVGDERGFGPERPVNRAEMAVVMGKLLSLDYNYYSTSCPFNDVYDWAQGWVGACAANGIVSGRGEGVYDPGATVTAVEAASMLMRALGYFKYQNDYADGFEVSTVRQGTIIGIFDGVGSSATEPMTRNQIAQMVLNALQSPVVEPDGNTINLTTPDGTVLTGKVNYVSVTSNKPFARAIGKVGATSIGSTNDGAIVELGERLYDGKLKLDDDYDPFGRPARNWEYDGKNIGVYAKKELIVFEHVGSVSGKDLYDVLGAKTIEDYKLTVNLDGVKDPKIVRDINNYDGNASAVNAKHNVDYVFDKNDLNRNNKATIGDTGTGVKTEVFVDNEADTIDVVIVNTYLARADKDYDTKKEELAVTAYSITKHTASGEYVKKVKNGEETEAFKLAAEEFSAVKDATKDTAFLLTVAQGEVQSVVPAEVLSGVQVSSFKVRDNVVVDGTTYNFDTTAGFDTKTLKDYTDLKNNAIINLKDLTYNVYLDVYGNLIGIEEVDAVKNYVFISAIDLNDSNLVNGTADARAIFIDGTTDTIRVNVGKSTLNYFKSTDKPGGYNKNSILNTWCTYTVNNNNVYTLKEVSKLTPNTDTQKTTNTSGLAQYHEIIADGNPAGSNELTIDKKHITLSGKDGVSGDFLRVYGDENTVYLTADLDELTNNAGTWGVIGGVDTISTGIEDTNLIVWENSVARKEADDKKTTTVQPGYSKTGSATRTDAPDLGWSQGVYTLYNDDGVIIAAIVVGEDNGASRNLVYVHTGDVDWEAYNGDGSTRAAGDGLFTWTRKVISNGEEITLTEVSEGDSSLARMKKYHWYQVKSNAKGEVIAAYQLPVLKDDGVNYEDDGSELAPAKLDRFKDLALDYDKEGVPGQVMGEIAYTVQNGGKTTVLYHNREFLKGYLRMSGRTLYVATDDQTGFIVDKDVSYVLQQWNSNKTDTFVETGAGASNLESVIKELNNRYDIFGSDGKWTGKSYTYQISAILESGVATSVVIYDQNNDYVKPGDSSTSTTSANGAATVKWNTPVYNPFTGQITATLNVSDVQEWVADSSDDELTVMGEVWINGYKSGDFSVGAKKAAKTITLNGGNTPYYGVPGGMALGQTYNVELRNVKVYANQVKVRMMDANGKVIRDSASTVPENRWGTEVVTWGNRFGYKVDGVTGTKNRHALSFWFGGGDTNGDTGAAFTWKVVNATANDKDTVLSGSGYIPGDAGDEIKVGNITANNNGYVDIVISWTKPAGPAPGANKYSVRETDASNNLVFSTSLTGPWSATLSGLEEGDTVYVKAVEKTADDGALLNSITTFANDDTSTDDGGMSASATDEAGVLKFTMPANNVAVKTASVSYCKVVDGFIKSDLSAVHLKLASGGTAPSGKALLDLAAEYINANAAELGIDRNSAEVRTTLNGATPESKLFFSKGGYEIGTGLADSAVKASDTNIAVDVETKTGTVHVVTDSGSGHTQISKILVLAGINADNSEIKVVEGTTKPFALVQKGKDITAVEMDASASGTTTVADGSTIKTNYVAGSTNKYVGYVKVDLVDDTAAALYTTSGALDVANVGNVTVAFKENAKLIVLDEDAGNYAMKVNDLGTGLELTIVLSHDKAGTIGGSAGDVIKAVVADSGTNSCVISAAASGTNFASANAVDSTKLAKDKTWAVGDTFDITVKVAPHGTAKNALEVGITLTSAN